MLFRISALRLPLPLLAILGLLAPIVFSVPALAAAPGTSLGTADESPIAVPFIGDFEVWCTDRNPAPGERCSRHHGSPAIDIGMDPGTPLYATGSGTVIDADANCAARGSCNNGMGNNVILEHADGTYSRYLHMADVIVSVDEVVEVGQPIGTSGESGQYSSPHLHYDEHFPFGSRTDMGQWVGCSGGEQVLYPEAFGTSNWNDVPYGSRIVSDGFDCLPGVDISTSAAPRVLAGTTHFAIAAPAPSRTGFFQVLIDSTDGTESQLLGLSGKAMLYLPAPESPITVRIRERQNGVWQRWSARVGYQTGPEVGRTCEGLAATTTSMTGTPGADVIIGTNGADRIDARGGDDIICGGAGDDVILAGPGRDTVFGGLGNDTISGGKGRDTISAQAGNDNVRGGEGADTIHGGSGDDIVHGTAGNDIVEGGNGADTVLGGIGHDILRGGADNDRVEGRNGRDYIAGGNGEDILLGGNGLDRLIGGAGIDEIDGGAGSDRCVLDLDAENQTIEELIGCER